MLSLVQKLLIVNLSCLIIHKIQTFYRNVKSFCAIQFRNINDYRSLFVGGLSEYSQIITLRETLVINTE